MSDEIIRGDDYGIRQPFWTHTLVDGVASPLNLASMTVRTTYKPAPTTTDADPDDTGAPIKHFITFDSSGAVTASSGFVLVSTAAAGILDEHLTRAETLALPLDVPLFHDIEITDQNGEVKTIRYTTPIVAVDAYTNRTTDV